jgi:hypothetical protein
MAAFRHHFEILPLAQQRLWRELADVPQYFVLYGGTAVALRLGHRTSLDFDFFTSRNFRPEELLKSLTYFGDGDLHRLTPKQRDQLVQLASTVELSFAALPRIADTLS